MKLGSPDPAPPDSCGHGYAVVGCRQQICRVIRHERIAVHEIEIGAVRDTIKEIAFRFTLHNLIPAYMRHTQGAAQCAQVLNAAFLVDDGKEAELVAAVRALGGTHAGVDVHIEVSGPWVPYSFARLGEGTGL